MSERYNGWSNRATWNVVLWVMNTEHVYRYIVSEICKGKKYTADIAKFTCEEVIFPIGKTPDDCNLSEVNWVEVAKAFNEVA